MKVYLKDQSILELTAPCILPEFNYISRIEISSPRYMPLSLDFEMNQDLEQNIRRTRSVFVKKKDGFLSYEADPVGTSHITSRLFPRTSIAPKSVFQPCHC